MTHIHLKCKWFYLEMKIESNTEKKTDRKRGHRSHTLGIIHTDRRVNAVAPCEFTENLILSDVEFAIVHCERILESTFLEFFVLVLIQRY